MIKKISVYILGFLLLMFIVFLRRPVGLRLLLAYAVGALILAGAGYFILVPIVNKRRGWYVYWSREDRIHYYELVGGKWEDIIIGSGYIDAKSHRVISLRPSKSWDKYPEWARHRKDEIISRLKSKFKEPGFKYLEK